MPGCALCLKKSCSIKQMPPAPHHPSPDVLGYQLDVEPSRPGWVPLDTFIGFTKVMVGIAVSCYKNNKFPGILVASGRNKAPRGWAQLGGEGSGKGQDPWWCFRAAVLPPPGRPPRWRMSPRDPLAQPHLNRWGHRPGGEALWPEMKHHWNGKSCVTPLGQGGLRACDCCPAALWGLRHWP